MSTMLPNTKTQSSTKTEILQIVIGVSMLFGCAQCSIPLNPVPITMHTVAVMLIGLFYSRKTAVKTVLTYLSLGAIGLPVFANFSCGMSRLIGPTGGYLVGFLVAVYAMTYMRERFLKTSSLFMICNCLLGHSLIMACGLCWLSVYVGFSQAITLGFLPFLIPAGVKAVLVGLAVRHIKK